MAGVSPSAGGTRQQRAAELKAEAERKARLEQEAARREREQSDAASAGDDGVEELSDEQRAAGGEDPVQQSTGPTGQGDYVVKPGDCIGSIAYSHGFFWETLWKRSENAGLRRLREDPSVLLPGDRVFLPEKRRKEESGDTEQHHRFRRRGVPAKLRVRILRNDEPRANQPYRLRIDGSIVSGTTDADGMIDVPIVPNARRVELRVGRGDDEDIYSLALGTLDPIDCEGGVRGRLNCLGYDAGSDLRAAIRDFQSKEGLTVTGQMDGATQTRLKERFGE